MNEETKQAIHLALEILRRTLVEQEVSMAVDKETGQLCFFDTGVYLETKKFDGIKVDMQSLVV